MDTYNYHLQKKRLEDGLSRRKMAKAIGVSHIRYIFIENGYSKPTKNETAKIGQYLNEDFSLYLNGPASNPGDLPEKTEKRIVRWAYEFVGRLWVRIVLGVITACCLGFFVSHFFVDDYLETHSLDFFSEDYRSFVVELQEKGEVRIALTGDFETPEYYMDIPKEDGYTDFITIYGHYRGSEEGRLNGYMFVRGEDYRVSFLWSMTGMEKDENGAIMLSATVNYALHSEEGVKSLSGFGMLNQGNNSCTYLPYFTEEQMESLSKSGIVDTAYVTGADYQVGLERSKAACDLFLDRMDTLLETKSTSPLRFFDLCQRYYAGSIYQSSLTTYAFSALILGIISSGISIFIFLFALVYGRKKGAEPLFVRNIVEIDDPPEDGKKPLKKDWRFGPILPETILVLVGIFLVFVGSFRLVDLTSSFFSNQFGSTYQSTTSNAAFSIFIMGMFLLYYTDFDIFLEDKRVIWKIFMYVVLFFCVYALELFLLNIIKGVSVFGELGENIPFPNMFSTVACYFAITFFLFTTPKWAEKSKGRLLFFRLLTIIPVAWTIVSWVLYRGDGVLFNLNWSIEVKYLFNGERAPFSILGIAYLVGYYFIRLFFIRRYGKKNANVFFNSNRFIWIKNAYVSLLVLIIGLVEVALSGNTIARKLDLGCYSIILILIPIVLLYHPHKGPRNRVFDWVINILYWAVLAYVYLMVALEAVVGLLMSLA